MRKLSIALLMIVCFSGMAYSQVTIRGIITDASDASPLAYANVVLNTLDDELYKGGWADLNGFYSINNVEGGRYKIQVSFIGFETFIDTIEVSSFEKFMNINVTLKVSESSLENVLVTGDGKDTDAGQIHIRNIDIQRMTTPAGSGDLAGYIQTLPGVVSTGDRGGNLFIRGGLPTENLTLMDGALIYQPYHIVGAFSVFPEELISSADFYAGGFGAKYVGRTSSVLDVTLKNGDLYETEWSVSFSNYLNQLYAESPIKEGKSSVIVLTRNSLIDFSSDLYGENQPLSFNSQFIKFNTKLNDNGGNCSFLTLRSSDEGKLDDRFGDTFRWRNVVFGGKCSGVNPNAGVSYMDLSVSYSRFVNEIGPVSNPDNKSNISIANTQLNLVQPFDLFRLEYGFFTNIRWFKYSIDQYFIKDENARSSLLVSGAYAQAIVPIGKKLELKPGVVMSSYVAQYGTEFDPRFQASFKPRGKNGEELSFAMGIYRQPVTGLSDFRDAGNVFTLWTRSPFSANYELNEHVQIQSSQVLLGWRQTIGAHFDYSIEGYIKDVSHLPISRWSGIVQLNTDLAEAEGLSQGFDVRLSTEKGTFFSTLGYGYSITEFTTTQPLFITWFGEESQTYSPIHDRRHQINALAGITLLGMDVIVNWKYGSGLPYTQPKGFDDLFVYQYYLPDVQSNYGVPRVLLDKPFNKRLPVFHQLDVSIGKDVELKHTKLGLKAGAVNSYNQTNVFYYDVYTRRRIDQLGFYPFLSIKVGKK